MGIDELIEKVRKAVQKSGYPLEQRVGYLLEKNGWHPFHSVDYIDPSFGKERELDILAYKIINERRIELRISCKKSISKPWVLFTEDAQRYYKHGNILKVTPVSSELERYDRIVDVLADLPFFVHPRIALNFTAFSGKELDNEGRTVIKDGVYSSLNSLYNNLFPDDLLFDDRGTVYFFITVFDGILLESYYNIEKNEDEIEQIHYGIWDKKMNLITNKDFVTDSNGRKVPLGDVLYWFSDWFRIEIITWNLFDTHLDRIEAKFKSLNENDINLFGKPWRPENFPKAVSERPKIK